mmetsp:Transcript_2233/g.3826  ORF Transcript_2233/g.3826 Transcript_2233/m.3826 type:complete len:308 (+) Transcript_2233:131-1054(+)
MGTMNCCHAQGGQPIPDNADQLEPVVEPLQMHTPLVECFANMSSLRELTQRDNTPMPHHFAIPSHGGTGCPQKRLLAYGDSLTAGFCNQGQEYHPYAPFLMDALMPVIAADIAMCGLIGLTAEQLLSQVDAVSIVDKMAQRGPGLRKIILQRGPFDLVLILVGTNDLSLQGHKGLDMDEKADIIFGHIKALHEVCHDAGVSTVSMSIPPNRCMNIMEGPWVGYRRLWDSVNAKLQSWASAAKDSAKGVALHVDTNRIVPYDEDSAWWEEDGLHLSPEGSAQLGQALAHEICAVLSDSQQWWQYSPQE